MAGKVPIPVQTLALKERPFQSGTGRARCACHYLRRGSRYPDRGPDKAVGRSKSHRLPALSYRVRLLRRVPPMLPLPPQSRSSGRPPDPAAGKNAAPVPVCSPAQERRYPCPFEGCHWRIKRKSHIARHLRTHMSTRPYPCTFEGCDKAFKSVADMRQHLISHREVAFCFCPAEGCGKGFKSQSRMTRHLAVHHQPRRHRRRFPAVPIHASYAPKARGRPVVYQVDRPFLCPVPGCNSRFRLRKHIGRHLVVHTPDKPWACTFEGCDKRFKRPAEARLHLRTHSGEKPYACPVPLCGKSFRTSCQKQIHIRSHSGEKPYACPVEGCGRRFSTGGNRKWHLLCHGSRSQPSPEEKASQDSAPVMPAAAVAAPSGFPPVPHPDISLQDLCCGQQEPPPALLPRPPDPVPFPGVEVLWQPWPPWGRAQVDGQDEATAARAAFVPGGWFRAWLPGAVETENAASRFWSDVALLWPDDRSGTQPEQTDMYSFWLPAAARMPRWHARPDTGWQ